MGPCELFSKSLCRTLPALILSCIQPLFSTWSPSVSFALRNTDLDFTTVNIMFLFRNAHFKIIDAYSTCTMTYGWKGIIAIFVKCPIIENKQAWKYARLNRKASLDVRLDFFCKACALSTDSNFEKNSWPVLLIAMFYLFSKTNLWIRFYNTYLKYTREDASRDLPFLSPWKSSAMLCSIWNFRVNKFLLSIARNIFSCIGDN